MPIVIRIARVKQLFRVGMPIGVCILCGSVLHQGESCKDLGNGWVACPACELQLNQPPTLHEMEPQCVSQS